MTTENQTRAEVLGKVAERANLTLAVADTSGGVYYFLVDHEGIPVFRFRPDTAWLWDDLTVEEIYNQLLSTPPIAYKDEPSSTWPHIVRNDEGEN